MGRNTRTNSSNSSALSMESHRRNSESSNEPMDISSSNKTCSEGNSSIALKTSDHNETDSEHEEKYLNRENHQSDTKMLRKKFRLSKTTFHNNNYSNNINDTSDNINNNHTHDTLSSDKIEDSIKKSTTMLIQNEINPKCSVCNLVFTSEHDLSNHIHLHNSDDSHEYKCHICSKIYPSTTSMEHHILTHTDEVFPCKYCNLNFTTKNHLNSHMNIHNNISEHVRDIKEHLSSESHVDDEGEEGGLSDSSISHNSEYSTNEHIHSINNNSSNVKNHNNDSNNSYNSSSTTNNFSYSNSFHHNESGKRKYIEEEHTFNSKRKMKTINNNNIINKISPNNNIYQNINSQQKFCCPVCDRNDFISMLALDNHMDKEHPSIQAKCRHCEVVFKSHKALNAHRCIKTNPNITQGFKDLTFVDFSSEKFPIIAKSMCEQSIRTPITPQKYECSKCYRAFPCATSLDIHVQECGYLSEISPQDYSIRRKRRQSSETSDEYHEDEHKRDDFFANLDLQNKSISNNSSPRSNVSSEIKSSLHQQDSKDLADIQSIINVTSSGGFLRQLDKSYKDIPLGRDDEEAQDAFTAEFRRMKLRGEFPCKLCTAIFPNLRALKGHNRVHLTSAGAGPYRCNMCPYSIHDKAALIRHMRTHNGDRPYECAVCNYAFTTKANCERHLRNRHAKSTREEVKRAIIYHPSEDSTADEHQHQKKLSMFNSPEFAEDEEYTPKDRSTPVSHLKGLLLPETVTPRPKSPIKIQVKSLEKLIHYENERIKDEIEEESGGNESDTEVDEETKPIDLSMDALDLSKKSKFEENKTLNNNIDNLSLFDKNQLLLAQQQFLNETLPKLDPAHYFQLSHLYRNFVFPPPGFPLHPFLLQNHLLPPSNLNDVKDIMMKDVMRGQMSGGNLMFSPQASTPPLSSKSPDDIVSQQKMSNSPIPTVIPNQQVPPMLNISPNNTQINNINNNNNNNNNINNNNNNNNNNGPVKMVIKNGVLMPKQKQRRYRTERPFACEHCSARFTLRSNMERHIKQQHPTFWAQRQRSGHSILRRGNGQPPSTIQPNSSPQLIPTIIPNNSNNFPAISDQVKYAILAQQLKYSKENKMHMPMMQENNNTIANNNNNVNTNNSNNNLDYQNNNHQEEEDDPKLIIDEDFQPEDLTKSEKKSPEPNIEAKKIAENILEQARKASTGTLNNQAVNLTTTSPTQSTQTLTDTNKDFDFKISPNLISKNDVLVKEEGDLVSVSKLVDNAHLMNMSNFFRQTDGNGNMEQSDEEGLVASGSASESNTSGPEDQTSTPTEQPKKKSAYSLAPNRVACPYCQRMFPWSSSLRRHILTHTGQKPFKCSHCPLLFTTKSNCDRHLLRKHGNVESAMSVAVPIDTIPDPVITTIKETKPIIENEVSKSLTPLPIQQNPISQATQGVNIKLESNATTTGQTSSELPYKCHLCDGSFSERNLCLEHIKNSHPNEFALLISKGAIDADSENANTANINEDEDGKDSKSGKYPDYANRKVICAFCIRRFWSTEDLRRHMRTHSGERPFQCDICFRKFTLKHSMLRHQKKHSNLNNNQQQNNSASDMSDEEPSSMIAQQNKLANIPDLIPKELAQWKFNQFRNSLTSSDSAADTFHSVLQQQLLQLPFLQQQLARERKNLENLHHDGDSDLIGNLLGISDQGILNKVLLSSADEAAKLLGVEK